MRIGIVDDHPLFRDGLRRLLDRSPDATVEWTHPNSIGLEAVIEVSPVDVVLMDIELGRGADGLETMAALTARRPALKVVIISGSLDPNVPRRALAAGAAAFLGKDSDPAEILAVLRRLAPALGARGRAGRFALTAREQRVLLEIQRGKTNREIAADLGISISTVNKHVQNVLKKLNVRNRAQAAAGLNASA